MSRWNLAWLLGICAVAVLGIAITQSAPLRAKDKDYDLVRLFVDVLDEVEHKYVRELDEDAKRKLVEDMVNGGLERLDPHSQYINPKKFRQFTKDSRGKFGGVGIQVSTDRQSGVLTVISPLVGTPAYEAGVLAGDLILKIDGKSTENMAVVEAVDLIQGEPGQRVTLTVLHEGSKEPVDLEMTRAMIHVQSALGDQRKPDNPEEWEFLIDKENKIGYIRLNTFSETAADELRKAVVQLQNDGVRGLILDLRNNPGGLLKEAVEVSDLFLAEGRIVSTRGRNGQEESYDAEEKGTLLMPAKDYPMVVLINKYSASASEIVAAALQDHHRAVIIGERSYGKGSVQNVIRMENGTSALKLTTASYWRPSGKNIHRFPDSKDTDEWGVKPDDGFEVQMKDEERLAYVLNRRDRDIIRGRPGSPAPSVKAKDSGQEYSDIIRGKPGTAIAAIPKTGKDVSDKDKDKKPFVDRVLNKALDYLRGEIKKVEAAPMLPEVRVG
jgi:carboxyl-terminal processing protease